MANVLQYRRPRRGWPDARHQRWRVPRASTVALPVLLGIAVGLYVTDGLLLDAPSFSGRSTFSLCKHGYHNNCVIDGDTIRYHGMKIRLADIDAPETYEFKCASELALGQRATGSVPRADQCRALRGRRCRWARRG